jgi:hypothetical protein
MKMIVKAGLVGGVLALPAQEAGAATKCVVKNGHRVCMPVHYKTVCTTSHGIKKMPQGRLLIHANGSRLGFLP